MPAASQSAYPVTHQYSASPVDCNIRTFLAPGMDSEGIFVVQSAEAIALGSRFGPVIGLHRNL